MATYVNKSFHAGPWQRAYSDWLVTPEEASRTYANGDIIKGPIVGEAVKTADAWVGLEPLDVNATPTATAQLEITNGTTTKKIVSLAAAQIKAGGIYRMNEYEGAGFVTPLISSSAVPYWYQLRFLTAFATAQAGKVRFGVGVTALNYGTEDPTSPTG